MTIEGVNCFILVTTPLYGHPFPLSNTAFQVALLAVVVTSRVWAQVGHDPDRSPYRDLQASHTLIMSVGYLAGSGGRLSAGPADGPLAGARYSLRLGGPFEAVLGLVGGRLQRVIYDSIVASDTAVQYVAIADAGFHFLITGQKSWRGLVPYFGATMGVVYADPVPADSGTAFRFRTKFQFGPQVGIRWYPSRGLSVRIEGRDILWRVRYPAQFFRLPAGAPPLDSSSDPDREWVHNPALTIALGVATRF